MNRKTLLCLLASMNFICSLLATPTGPSSEPYITGDTWRNNVDHVLSDVENFSPADIKRGDAIFVEQDSLSDFYHKYIPKIQVPYILVTANCDRGGDDPMPGRYEAILEDPNLFAWFTQNIDRSGHPKLHPIPIGLANQKYHHGRIELFNRAIPEARTRTRSQWVYVNFTVSTNSTYRRPVWDYFQHHRLNGMIVFTYFKDPFQYLQEVPNYRFVLSPRGGGLDTHRTWEALLLGSYPIVVSSTLDPLYEELPVLILNDWQELTPELLISKNEEFQNGEWNFEKLYFPYWFQKLQEVKQKLLGQTVIPKEVTNAIQMHIASNVWEKCYYDVLPKVIEQHQYKKILEVGVALGGHAEHLLRNTNIQQYIGVDPYRSYDPQDGFQIDVAKYSREDVQKNFDYLYEWVQNIRLSRFSERSRLIRKPSIEAAAMFNDESLDCVFIDGDHRFEGVLQDLQAWYPKVKKGHLILGDDFWMAPVAAAVNQFFLNQGKEVFFYSSTSGYKIWAVYK